MIRLVLLIAFLAFSAAPARAACTPPSDGLIAHWKLDEMGNTSTAADSAGTNDGTLINFPADPTPNWSTGKVDGSLLFDGNDRHVRMPASSDLNFAGRQGTVTLWAKLDTPASGYHFMIDNNTSGTPGDGWDLIIDDPTNGVKFAHRTTGNSNDPISAAGLMDDLQWHFIAATINDIGGANEILLYIDGNAPIKDAGSTGSLIDYTGANTYFGLANGNSNEFPGSIDDVRIYNRALSADEIAALYAVRSTADADPGVMMYDARHARMMYCNGTDWVHAGTGAYNPNAVTFDGTNDHLRVLAASSGVEDSKRATGSFWFRRNATGATQSIHYSDTSTKYGIWFDGGANNVRIVGKTSAGTQVLSIRSTAVTDTNWHHFVYSFDMSDPAGTSCTRCHIYIDGANGMGTKTTFTTDAVIDFNDVDTWIGYDGTSRFNGDLADYWFDTGTYIDLSQESNRRKFRSSSGMPMYLGPDGSLPTGQKPDIFLTGATDSWHINYGSGGGFTENGALTTAASQPGDELLVEGGDAYCWGSDGVAQLGISTSDDSNTQPATPAAGGHKWTQISGGNQSHCALKDNGDAYCWGRGSEGQIGDGGTGTDHTPKIVSGGHKWVKISSGYQFSCGITTGGDAYCWGQDGVGQLGNDDGNTGNHSTPQLVAGGFSWIDIEAGDEHACGIRDNGAAYCWGRNDEGQMGCGGCSTDDSPQLVLGSPSGTAWTHIAAGWTFSCGLRDDGTAWCWGSDSDGRLGNGAPGNSTVPSAVAGGHSFVSISAGDANGCALKANGEAWCWGSDDDGEQGNGGGVTHQSSPGLVQGGHTWRKVEAAYNFTCGITTAGDAYCWGADNFGQLGNGGTTGDQHLPSLVQGGYKWIDIAPQHVYDGSSACGIVEYGCVNPDGVKGQMMYNSDFNVMQYCNGAQWVPMGPVGGTPPTDGLVGHWKLDESSGNAADSSGNGFTGTVQGNPVWQPSGGKIGGALAFDGSGDQLSYSDPGNVFEFDNAPFTVSAWIKTSAGGAIASRTGSSTAWAVVGTPDMYFWTDSDGWASGSSSDDVDDDQWHHTVWVFDESSGTVYYYIDGQLNGSASYTPANWPDGTLTIGFANIGHPRFTGLMDDVRIYNRALTAQEISQLYYFGLSGGLGDVSGNCASPVMSEGSMVYNTDHAVMQYCNGEKWIGIGWAP